jgi:WD repeat-containing protein 19
VIHVYCRIACSVQGPGVKLVGRQQATSRGAVPLTLHGGVLAWHLPSGALQTQLLDTHAQLAGPGAGSNSASRSNSGRGQQLLLQPPLSDAASGGVLGREELLAARCQQALALCHFGQALDAARRLGDPQLLQEVALTALQFLDVPTAVAAYEAAGDEEALQQLRPLLGMQDGNLLAGRIITITGGALAATCHGRAVL